MKLGVAFPQLDIGTDPIAIRDFAQAAEGAGFDYLIAYDHVLGGHPDRFDGPAPFNYEHAFHEPLTLFCYLAAVTQRLRFTTSVLLLPQRQTALVAKQAAEVDILSSGRFWLSVGVGWNHVEYEGLNEDFHTRGRRIEEQIDVLRHLWTEPLVTFKGRWHHLDRTGINPLPVQQPIPIWIGSGASDRSLQRVARLADGWMPLLLPGQELPASLERLRGFAEDAGRDPATISIEARVMVGQGDPDAWRARADELRGLGVSHLTLSTGRGATTGQLIEMLSRVRPVFQ